MARAVVAPPTLTGAFWTRNGDFFGNIRVPRGANDAHLDFPSSGSRPSLQFTRDGAPLGRPILPPPGANDVGFKWPGRRGLPVLIFTKNGRLVGPPFLPPAGADDLHIDWRNRRIVGANWSRNGVPLLQPIPVPQGANDAHFHLLWR